MEQIDLLRHVVRVLDELGIAYGIVGSYASAAWGEARFTQDIDVVIALRAQDVDGLVAAFPPDEFYIWADSVREAVAHHSQFNVLHPSSGCKVDFMIEGTDEWGRGQIQRRRRIEVVPGVVAFVGAPEDIIISKMMYYREGGSEKHLRDITGMLRISTDQIDRSQVVYWAQQLGLTDIWEAICRRLSL